MIKLFSPNVTDEALVAGEVIESGNWASGAGTENVRLFERKFADYLGCKEVVAVNSGTAALHLALSLINIKGKEVILPALSFVSTANVILYNGGIPVFADVDEETLCMDWTNLPITNNTACMIPVHFGGMKCDLHRTNCIEDSAHRIERDSITHTTCFSFHPVKNLAMPCGGAIAIPTNLQNDMDSTKCRGRLRARRWCGITDRVDDKYDVKELGWNYYMNEISAAIGLVQLEKLDEMNARRVEIADSYSCQLEFPCMPFSKNCSYHLYWIRVKNRDQFRKKMLEAGIETGTHYKPINQMSLYGAFRGFERTPITEKVAKEIVTLPMHTNLSDKDIDHIIKTANKC